ncbi:Coiled stalk of trimeric autotransporter adhesin [Bartonella sp. JB63]|nr:MULTISPECIES: Vomp family autotransporter [unclassified Bartonella]AQX28371.1 Coiled stalk of trimeric autotransporter adhesin [Bartonella sp. JB15]AQX29638.1 Coiled stalk of trimeric autotransporter adhesin [Bartonella sp. JB63]
MKKISTPNIVKAVSLGVAVSVLLSSVSPIFSANVAITGATNQSSNAPSSLYAKGSHGSIVFSGDDDHCGVDNVTGHGAAGYDPKMNANSISNDFVWKSTKGAISIGSAENGQTRQIVGVAAGTQETDAVNVGQLKALRELATKSWQLSVNGENAADIGADSIVDFSGASDNITVVKDSSNGKTSVKFELGQIIRVSRVIAGLANVSNAGFVITGGPNMTIGGIFAGNKTLTGVADGILLNDAVNVRQLNEVKNTIAGNSLVGQDSTASVITIGQETGGNEINIVNNKKEKRKISGVSGGAVTEESTEAINGGQLWETNGKISELENDIGSIETSITQVRNNLTTVATNTSEYFGGGADVLNGKAPNYEIDGITYDDIGSAFEGVDVAFTEINEKISNITENGLVRQDDTASVITIGQETGGNEINIVNNKKEKRKISGISGGAVTEESTEAINGGQLWETNGKISELENNIDGIETNITQVRNNLTTVTTNTSEYFGGGADVLKGKAPDYVINEVTYNDVGSAFEGVDVAFTEINETISDLKENNLVQQNGNMGLITIGKKTGGNEINIKNSAGKERRISGVADGTLSNKSKDAVNGSQLWTTNQNVQELNDNVDKVSGNVTTIAKNVSKYFGGDTDVMSGKAPTYVIKGVKYNDVGSAFVGVDGSITQINNQISEITKNNLVQQDINTQLITIGKGMGGTKIDISEGQGKDRTLSGVKDAVRDNEAVNKAQLDQSLKDITQDFEFLSGAVVLYDKKSDGSVDYENITLGGNSKPVALHNVKDGKISSESSDAVNGKQINKFSNEIANIFGGGTRFGNGAFTRPTYTLSDVTTEGEVQRKIYNDVGSAFVGLDMNIRNINKHIEYVVDDFNEKITNFSSDALLWSDQEKAFVALHGSKGQVKENSRLTFLLDGEIAVNSTDAITGNQLFETNSKLASYFGGSAEYKNGQWKDPTFTVYQFGPNGLVSQKGYNNVTDAFAGVNGGMSALNDRIKKIENQGGQGGQGGFDPDALKWNEEKGAYDASRYGEDGKITNVADGKVEKDAKDAVNGGQLWDTNQRVTNVENKVENISNTINGVVEGAVQYDKDEKGKKTNKITLAGGDAGKPVVIDNVADGKIEKGSKEAVNGGQLHDYTKQQMEVVLDDAKKYTDEKVKNIVVDAIDDAVDKAKDYTNMRFDLLNYGIEETRKEARQAAAIGLAVSNLRYNDTPGALSVAFGGGLWRSQSALAVGAGYTSINGNVRSNVSVTGAGGHWGIGAGLTFTLPVR